MKKSIIIVAMIILWISGCQSEITPSSAPSVLVSGSTSTLLPTIMPIVTPEPKVIPMVERFQLPLRGELLLFDHHLSDIAGWAITREKTNEGLKLSFTENQGKDWFTTILPTKQSWENAVDKQHLFASLNATGSSWVMLTSEPSLSMIIKTLYRSDDNGRSWMLLGDFTAIIGGDVKGMLFINDNKGWIASSYRGTDLVPFYRTLDGGRTWNLEELPLEKGYRYGNVSPPVFHQVGHATVKVEYVRDAGNKTVYYETTDNGDTWHRFTLASILQLNGDKAALEVARQFAAAWQAKDEKKVRSLFEAGNVEYISQYITQLKKHTSHFYSAFTALSETPKGEFCVGLQFQNEEQAEYDVGTMAVCLRKQPKSDTWKVYMLD